MMDALSAVKWQASSVRANSFTYGFSRVPVQDSHHSQSGPLLMLSVNLLKTYKHINQVYYEQQQKKEKVEKVSNSISTTTQKSERRYNGGFDDANADYIVREGEIFHDRYEILHHIGKGSFGQVVKAHDKKNDIDVAIKIIKNKKPFARQALIEIDILQSLNRKDPHDEYGIVRLLHQFTHCNHLCLVTELLSLNLYEFLRRTRFQGFSLNLIREFGVQIVRSLLFLKRPVVGPIIHCDLKPENILLKSSWSTVIKTIDFGSSCRLDQKMYQYIQSRFYRSPEVLLGLSYGTSIDIWSLGCILVELHTGEPLFGGRDEVDQLAKIVTVKGYPPEDMVKQSPKGKKFFRVSKDGNGRRRFVMPTLEAKCRDVPFRFLDELLGAQTGGPHHRFEKERGHSPRNYFVFQDLIERMLDYDPDTRITPEQCLEHPFFRGYVPSFLRDPQASTVVGHTSRPPPDQDNPQGHYSSSESFTATSATSPFTVDQDSVHQMVHTPISLN